MINFDFLDIGTPCGPAFKKGCVPHKYRKKITCKDEQR